MGNGDPYRPDVQTFEKEAPPSLLVLGKVLVNLVLEELKEFGSWRQLTGIAKKQVFPPAFLLVSLIRNS